MKETIEAIKKVSVSERLAGYLLRVAELASVGAQLRSKKEDEDWTEQENKLFEAFQDSIDPWLAALSEEEKQFLHKFEVELFAPITRGEIPPGLSGP